MKKLTILLTTSVFLSLTSSAFALSLEFENKSSWQIHELYFSPANESDWGPDQLGEHVIEPDEVFTLNKIAKNVYDVKIVDEDGDSCEIPDVNFKASEHFVLSDDVLLGCQENTDQE